MHKGLKIFFGYNSDFNKWNGDLILKLTQMSDIIQI